MKIKTTMKYHDTPIRMAKIHNIGNSKCWRGCGATGTLSFFIYFFIFIFIGV